MVLVRFIRHGQSECNLYNITEKGDNSVCDVPGGGESSLSEKGVKEAKLLNSVMKGGKTKSSVTHAQYKSATYVDVIEKDASFKILNFKKKNAKGYKIENTPVLVSSMQRAKQTAEIAFEGIEGVNFEVTDLLREVVWGDNYFKMYKGYVKLAKQIKKRCERETPKISQIALVCHHNTIRYMICALCFVYSKVFPKLEINVLNAGFLDIEFIEHQKWFEMDAYNVQVYTLPKPRWKSGIYVGNPLVTRQNAENIFGCGKPFDKGGTTHFLIAFDVTNSQASVYELYKSRPDLEAGLSKKSDFIDLLEGIQDHSDSFLFSNYFVGKLVGGPPPSMTEEHTDLECAVALKVEGREFNYFVVYDFNSIGCMYVNLQDEVLGIAVAAIGGRYFVLLFSEKAVYLLLFMTSGILKTIDENKEEVDSYLNGRPLVPLTTILDGVGYFSMQNFI